MSKDNKRSYTPWTREERLALWSSINRWCQQNGVHAFSDSTFDYDRGADDVNAACYNQTGVLRNAGMVRSQVLQAINTSRVNPNFGNKPIKDLLERAEAMRVMMRKKISVSNEEKYPSQAIPIPQLDESGNAQENVEEAEGSPENDDLREINTEEDEPTNQEADFLQPAEQHRRMESNFGTGSDDWNLNADALAWDAEDHERMFVDPVYAAMVPWEGLNVRREDNGAEEDEPELDHP